MIKILFFCALTFSIGCRKPIENKAKTPLEQVQLKDFKGIQAHDTLNRKVKTFTAHCLCPPYGELSVQTEYMTCPDSINPFHLLPLSQVLTIQRRIDGSKITLSLPFLTWNYNLGDTTLTALQTSLSGVKCIEKDGRAIFSLRGIYCVDPPHEFFAFCSTNGEWLWYFYGSRHEIFKEFGEEESLIKYFGEEINNMGNMTKVMPEID